MLVTSVLIGALSNIEIVSVLVIGLIISVFGRIIFLVYAHPLRKYPGPKLWAVSRLPWHYYNTRGILAWKILELHQNYGPTIRIAPDELSYTTSQAWKKIYGQLKPEFPKCLDGRGIAPVNPQKHLRGLLAADHDKHARLRRAIAPAFSDRALREQESCLQKHSSNLVKHLRNRCQEGPIDIVKWFSLTTFDIISDLAFGQPEGCLDSADQPWLSVMGARARSIVWLQFSIYYRVEWLIKWVAPKSLTQARQQHMKMLAAKIQRRIKESPDSKDFMSYILDNKTEKLTNAELVVMASAFIVAGSGTSARALSATIFYLTTCPDKLRKATEEVRRAFQATEDISMRSSNQLHYLQACIDEAMRLHPPQPGALPRFVPGVGDEIEGKFVPGGIAVGVHQLSSGQAEWNFSRATEFIPERWLEQPAGSTVVRDDRASRQPFSYGPRNCIGMNLAYAEMLLIMAKLLFVFDIEQDPSSRTWVSRQKSYVTWEQIPLLVWLRGRN